MILSPHVPGTRLEGHPLHPTHAAFVEGIFLFPCPTPACPPCPPCTPISLLTASHSGYRPPMDTARPPQHGSSPPPPLPRWRKGVRDHAVLPANQRRRRGANGGAGRTDLVAGAAVMAGPGGRTWRDLLGRSGPGQCRGYSEGALGLELPAGTVEGRVTVPSLPSCTPPVLRSVWCSGLLAAPLLSPSPQPSTTVPLSPTSPRSPLFKAGAFLWPCRGSCPVVGVSGLWAECLCRPMADSA